MWISSLSVENIKGFKKIKNVIFSKGINILIGSNNSGKSSILKCIQLLQANPINTSFIKLLRKGENSAKVTMMFQNISPAFNAKHSNLINEAHYAVVNMIKGAGTNDVTPSVQGKHQNSPMQFRSFVDNERDYFIVPYFSKRKVIQYSEIINTSTSTSVFEDLQHIISKIDRISSPRHPKHKDYERYVQKTLDFMPTTFASEGGKQAGLQLPSEMGISLSEMGEGVVNILGLIERLCTSEGKVFLIEELENDIHPKALKALLEIIIEKSETNQFFISTHSNIVLKYLASVTDSKAFQLKSIHKEGEIPENEILEVENTPEKRLAVLEDLGYDLFDYDLHKGFIIFEEFSAESIAKCLIPHFAPGLKNKIQTIAASGVSDVKARLSDILRLFIYTNLSSPYKGKAWVIADGDAVGKEAINELIKKFSDWDPKHFINLKHENLEQYYPKKFKKEAEEALVITDKQKKREAKKELLLKVLEWAQKDQKNIDELGESMNELVTKLKEIEKSFN